VDGPPPERLHERVPRGTGAMFAAAMAALPVLLFDELEGVLGDRLPDGGGPVVLVAIVALFAAVWLAAGSAALWALAREPQREGIWAGALVAALMVIRILTSLADDPGLWLVLILVVLPLGALSVGLGALAGLLAGALRDPAAAPRARRAGSWTAIGAGITFFALTLPFSVGGVGLFAFGIIAFASLLVLGGMLGLAGKGRPAPPPKA
jgi:hypothetical protein